jgi:AcrR family transcriptional regulator
VSRVLFQLDEFAKHKPRSNRRFNAMRAPSVFREIDAVLFGGAELKAARLVEDEQWSYHSIFPALDVFDNWKGFLVEDDQIARLIFGGTAEGRLEARLDRRTDCAGYPFPSPIRCVSMKASPRALKPKPAQTQAAPARQPGITRANTRRDGAGTRERILDAAEELFAIHGFHGTSMRDVAEVIGSGIALVTYHFGTKDVLFSTVIKRRAAYMAHERILALDAARARVQGKALPVEDLVSGYVWPFVERSVAGGKGWKNYSLFVARHANSPEFSKILSEHYDPVARQYLNEFERTFPGMPQKDLYYAFSFMVGAMVATVAEPGRVEHLSFGQIKASDVEEVFKRMLPFLSAGFKSLVPQPS